LPVVRSTAAASAACIAGASMAVVFEAIDIAPLAMPAAITGTNISR
jgi:hypothetical protein